MQGPPPSPMDTEDDEAFIPTEHLRNGQEFSADSRKARKRTTHWQLVAEELKLALLPQQDEYIQENKRPRLQKPFPTSTNEATSNDMSHDTAIALLLNTAADNHDDADPVMDMHPNARAIGIARLVPRGRTKKQCRGRWRQYVDNLSTIREEEHGTLNKATAL
jgi:hypothetical protein